MPAAEQLASAEAQLLAIESAELVDARWRIHPCDLAVLRTYVRGAERFMGVRLESVEDSDLQGQGQRLAWEPA